MAVLASVDLRGTDLILVGLGTNDHYRPEVLPGIIDQVMATAGGRRVVWINVGGFVRNKDRLNAALWDATNRWPRLWVLDWEAEVVAHPWVLGSDGIHLSAVGNDHRANTITRFLRTGA